MWAPPPAREKSDVTGGAPWRKIQSFVPVCHFQKKKKHMRGELLRREPGLKMCSHRTALAAEKTQLSVSAR